MKNNQFNQGVKIQSLCCVLLVGVVLGCRFYLPSAYRTIRQSYLALFESPDYTPSLLRFSQKAIEVLSMEAQATDAPEGASLEQYQTEQKVVPPVKEYWISSEYGWRKDPLTWQWDFHNGLDLAAEEGAMVLAAMEGLVECNYLSESYGNCVRIRHADGSVSLYAHMQYAFARVGEMVSAGQQIGTVGQTGRATGPHLHFELLRNDIRYDPTKIVVG